MKNATKITPGYWETVFRTNTQTAYVAGKLQQYKETKVAAYQLMVIEDVRTSAICRNLLQKTGYGITLPADHQFWKTYGFPLYHFNCRTSIRGVWQSQIRKTENAVSNLKMTSAQIKNFKPQGDFGGNPLDGSWWKLTEKQKKQAKKFGILSEIKAKEKDIFEE